jgi:hypothetical protein
VIDDALRAATAAAAAAGRVKKLDAGPDADADGGRWRQHTAPAAILSTPTSQSAAGGWENGPAIPPSPPPWPGRGALADRWAMDAGFSGGGGGGGSDGGGSGGGHQAVPAACLPEVRVAIMLPRGTAAAADGGPVAAGESSAAAAAAATDASSFPPGELAGCRPARASGRVGGQGRWPAGGRVSGTLLPAEPS